MNQELVQWQVQDSNGFIFPWFTWPMLDELRQWNMSSITWLEFGAGRSTAWLRSKCAWVDSIEANYRWAQDALDECREANLTNGRIKADGLSDGVPNDLDAYVNLIPKDKAYDVISIDGIFRTEMVEWAIEYFKKSTNGGILIMDNLDQDFVWISERTMQLLKPYVLKRYFQAEHTDHQGKQWNTSMAYIPKTT